MVVALIAAGCGAKGDEKAIDSDGESSATTAAEGTSSKFGTLDSPCGPGDATIKPEDAGKGTDKLYVGASSDKGSQIRPGLLGEMFDAGMAFAKWCNAQGGIAGLPIEVVDLDGKLFEVTQAI